jgi:hypothetical protein
MERDRLDRIEMDLARVSRQIAGLPVRIARSGGGGGGGASGTFVCTLSSNIGASTPGGTMTAGTGTVYSIGEDGELTEVGTRDIFNPFTCTLPSAAAQYTCAKTFEGATDADDQFTIVGPDMMQVLYSLTGSAEKTTLSLPSGETSAADIQWLGGDC